MKIHLTIIPGTCGRDHFLRFLRKKLWELANTCGARITMTTGKTEEVFEKKYRRGGKL